MILLPVPPGVEVRVQTRRAGLAVFLVLAMAGASDSGRAQQGPVPAPPDPAATAAFTGLWDYNALESVNAATGRPEQTPQNAARRNPVAGQPPAGGGSGGGSGTGGGGGSGGGGGRAGGATPGSFGVGGMGGGGGRAGRQMQIIETRQLVRDLLEVPEALTFKVTPESVSITDDLDRERTYPTDNKKRKYQLGAAQFDARARWDGAAFKKDIEAAAGFKMFETYFLSDDGNRMFVIIRIGPQTKDAPVVGVNRVYDRDRRQR